MYVVPTLTVDHPSCSALMHLDLVTLDADTNGCIDNYFDESGKSTLLDPKKFKVLSRCRAELFLVLKELEGDGREYFQRLLQIASGILEEQEK